jgi:hypothetical protein
MLPPFTEEPAQRRLFSFRGAGLFASPIPLRGDLSAHCLPPPEVDGLGQMAGEARLPAPPDILVSPEPTRRFWKGQGSGSFRHTLRLVWGGRVRGGCHLLLPFRALQ